MHPVLSGALAVIDLQLQHPVDFKFLLHPLQDAIFKYRFLQIHTVLSGVFAEIDQQDPTASCAFA